MTGKSLIWLILTITSKGRFTVISKCVQRCETEAEESTCSTSMMYKKDYSLILTLHGLSIYCVSEAKYEGFYRCLFVRLALSLRCLDIDADLANQVSSSKLNLVNT